MAVTKAPAFRRKISLAAAADMLLIGMEAMLGAYYALVVFALDVVVLVGEDEGGKGCNALRPRLPDGSVHHHHFVNTTKSAASPFEKINRLF